MVRDPLRSKQYPFENLCCSMNSVTNGRFCLLKEFHVNTFFNVPQREAAEIKGKYSFCTVINYHNFMQPWLIFFYPAKYFILYTLNVNQINQKMEKLTWLQYLVQHSLNSFYQLKLSKFQIMILYIFLQNS